MINRAKELCSKYSGATARLEELQKEADFYKRELEEQHPGFETYVLRSRLSEAETKMKACRNAIGMYRAFTLNLDSKKANVLEQVYGRHMPWSEIVNEQNQILSRSTVGRTLRSAYAEIEAEIEKMEAEYATYIKNQEAAEEGDTQMALEWSKNRSK